MTTRIYHIGKGRWQVVLERLEASDGIREAGWHGWVTRADGAVGRRNKPSEFVIGPHDEADLVFVEFEARHPSAKHYREPEQLAPERLRVRRLREQVGMSRGELERLCGFSRGQVRRFELCHERVEMLVDRRRMMTMLRVLYSRWLSESNWTAA